MISEFFQSIDPLQFQISVGVLAGRGEAFGGAGHPFSAATSHRFNDTKRQYVCTKLLSTFCTVELQNKPTFRSTRWRQALTTVGTAKEENRKSSRLQHRSTLRLKYHVSTASLGHDNGNNSLPKFKYEASDKF